MEDCIFCKIIKGEIPTQFVWEDREVVAFRDIKPVAPVHILILPKKHIDKLQDISDNEKELLGKMLLVAKEIAEKEGMANSGYRIGINCGKDAGQIVFHLHFHLIGGWRSKDKIVVP